MVGGRPLGAVPAESRRARPPARPAGRDVPATYEAPAETEDDAWTEARLLSDTVEDHELIDPLLSAERLLLRLFTSAACAPSRPRGSRKLPMLAPAHHLDAEELLGGRPARDGRDDGMIAGDLRILLRALPRPPDDVDISEAQLEAR